MRVSQASDLYAGQILEWIDGRICQVQQNIPETKEVRLIFGDGMGGLFRYEALFPAILLEIQAI